VGLVGQDADTQGFEGCSMAWVMAFVFASFAGFLFNAELAHHVPLTSVVIRQTMIGSLIGLATGYAIHVFHRPF
jgi:hypothetical protein